MPAMSGVLFAELCHDPGARQGVAAHLRPASIGPVVGDQDRTGRERTSRPVRSEAANGAAEHPAGDHPPGSVLGLAEVLA